MKKEMYHQKSHQELSNLLKEAQIDLGKLRFQLKDPSNQGKSLSVSQLKKQVARIKTALVSKNNKQ